MDCPDRNETRVAAAVPGTAGRSAQINWYLEGSSFRPTPAMPTRPGIPGTSSVRDPPLRAEPRGASNKARASVCPLCPVTDRTNAGRGARCVDAVRRAQIADGVNGPRADASESIRRAECAAPCLSLHVRCLAGGLAFCVAAQGHAARRRLSERYTQRYAGRGGILRGGARPCSPAASQRSIPEAKHATARVAARAG